MLGPWLIMKNKKGTPLWKALFRRLPWRYKNFLLQIFHKIYNTNTKRYWNKRFEKFDSEWRSNVYEDLLNFLPKKNKFSLLDIGCALGDGCYLLKKKYPNSNIEGCDFSDVSIRKAKQKKIKVRFFVLSILKEAIPKKYDYITMVSILEHFDNPFPVIDKCLKKVRNRLIISCPYNGDIGFEHKYKFNEKTLETYNHQHYRKGGRIIYLVEKKNIFYKNNR